jgi:hypothetical protein
MITFLKIFFGLVLLGLGLFIIIASPFAMIIGGGAFIVQLIIGIALIAGAFTLFIKVRR